MTRVNFYEIGQDREAAWRFCCRLTHKLRLQNRRVLIHLHDKQEASLVSELLWSLEPESFLPHRLIDENEIPETRVLLNWLDDPTDHHDVLINLTPGIPSWFSRFEVVAELVYYDEHYLKAKREVFQFYRHRGYALDHHRLPPQ